MGGIEFCNARVKKATSSFAIISTSLLLFFCLCLLLRRLLCCVRRPRVVSLAFVCWAISINPMVTMMVMVLKLFMLFYLCCDNVLGLCDGVIAMVNEIMEVMGMLLLLWFTHIEVCFAYLKKAILLVPTLIAHQLLILIISLRMPYRRVLGWSLLPLLLTWVAVGVVS